MMDGETDEGAIVMWCVHNETAESAGRINGGGHFGHPLNDFFRSNTFSEKQRREL